MDRAYLGFHGMKRAKEFCYIPAGRNASPSEGYPLAGTHLFTCAKRDKVEKSSLSKETTWRARLESRTPRSVVWDVSPSATHASTAGLTEISISGFRFLAREMVKYSWTELLDEILWHPMVILLYTITVPRNTHPVWHCPQKSYSALANYSLANYLLEENWQISPVGCAYFQN